MESHPSVTDRPVRVPPIVWFLGAGLIAALVAVFVFNVALNTVVYYGFIALMFGSHLFMHGGMPDTVDMVVKPEARPARHRTLTKRIKTIMPDTPVVATRGGSLTCYSKTLYAASVFNAEKLISSSSMKV